MMADGPSPTTIDDGPERAPRIRWIDCGKGLIICIIAVQHAALLLGFSHLPSPSVSRVIWALEPIGMPYFFLVSGMFAGKHIRGDWPAMLRDRVIPLLWPMLVWAALGWVVTMAMPASPPFEYKPSFWTVPLTLILPFELSHLWFIWALAAFLIAAKAGEAIGRRKALTLALIASVVALAVSPWHFRHHHLQAWLPLWPYVRSAALFFFFYAGLVWREEILRVSRLPAVPGVIAAAALYGVAVVLAPLWQAGVVYQGFWRFVAGCSGTCGAFFILRGVVRVPVVGEILERIGIIALPVYLSHMLFVMLLVYGVLLLDWPLLVAIKDWLPLAVGLGAILLSCALALVIGRPRLRWLVAPPRRLTRPRSTQRAAS